MIFLLRLSISKAKLFKACRRAYGFKYLENLIPIKKSDALETGTQYHQFLEELNKNGDFTIEYTKSCAMACAYKKYIYPRLSYKTAEKWLEKDMNTFSLVGIADGIAEDGAIVEHKTTGIDLAEYEYNLQWDEQLAVYMYLTGARKAYYTICKKPTIRQKKNESDEEFFNRMVAWYDEDTEDKITLLEITLSDEDVASVIDELSIVASEITDAENDRSKLYKNTCNCKAYFTPCEYASICMNYNPNETYVGFEKGE